MSISALEGIRLGNDLFARSIVLATSVSSLGIPNQNDAAAMRFIARKTDDPIAIKVVWVTIATAGTVECRIETDSNGAPSGTLYDTNATKSLTPTQGVQTFTFDTPPSSGLTVGNHYWIVLKTTAAGTTHDLGYVSGILNTMALQKSTAGGAYARQAGSPNGVIVFEGSTYQGTVWSHYSGMSQMNANYDTAGYGIKFELLSSIVVSGIDIDYLRKVGTPSNPLRFRLFKDNTVVNGSTISIPELSVTSAAISGIRSTFDTDLTLTSGTYRLIADSAGSTASNYYRFADCAEIDDSACSPNFIKTTCADVGSPSWTDSSSPIRRPSWALILASIPSASGGSSPRFGDRFGGKF